MENYTVSINGKKFLVEYFDQNTILINGKQLSITFDDNGYGGFKINGKTFCHNGFCKFTNDSFANVWINRFILDVEIEDYKTNLLKSLKKNSASADKKIIISAPMPGLVKKIEVEENQIVKIETGLIILEAMKMENEIKSKVNGIVKEIKVKNNSSVEKGAEMIIIEINQ
ncbi:MAG: acetyl-CoA carboxylase biotin carboxyl carrier protein subunit [Ignavibacteriales bacterium]|nr:acetyl-CoA carboxylase biotin carboxyl carrier protein subunit [Ignavibacteriales bacterium]